MSYLPYAYGHSLPRWQQVIDALIEKYPGDHRVEKLRVILLYEADFNWQNKRFARQLASYAEHHGLFAPEQFGSRKEKAAIDHGLNKVLTFDISLQKRQPLAVAPNNLKSC
jgi:hypothetical protein